ncbi:MAG: c-type cytochrome [Alphaproteobacteria bacterium]
MRTLIQLIVLGGLIGILAVIGLLVTDTTETIEISGSTDRAMVTAERGELLLGLAGCVNCHTAPAKGSAPLAGGRELKTPFGSFYAPNITSDKEHGIGDWSEEDFVRALRHGRRPDGANYFPAFPYVAYTRMTDTDMLAIWAAIMARPSVPQADTPHAIGFPFNQRWTMRFWKLLHFDAGAYELVADKPDSWNRGAYISEALAHCGECHTPRWPDGGLDRRKWMTGVVDGPEGEMAPNLTPHDGTGIGGWDDTDLSFVLTNGLKPDGDVVGSVMYEVVENGTGKLQAADVAAIVEYLKSLPATENAEAAAAQVE